MSCRVENFTPTVSLGSSSVYSLLLDPSGFLPVPFLGSFFFFLPSSKGIFNLGALSAQILLTSFCSSAGRFKVYLT